MEVAKIEVLEVSGDLAVGRVHRLSLEEANKVGAPIIQWVWNPVEVRVVKPVALGKKVEEVGLGEAVLQQVEVGSYVQFMRYGFLKKAGPGEFVSVHVYAPVRRLDAEAGKDRRCAL